MKKHIILPFDEKTIQELRIGDVVYLDGLIFTARDQASKKLASSSKNQLGFIPSEMALYHCGPLMKKKKSTWEVVSAGPTTSNRMDDITSDLIDMFSLRCIIGKGLIGEKTVEALKDQGVFLVFTGGAGALAADLIKKVKEVKWLDELGMAEAVWMFSVEEFGPLIVAIDAHGNNLFQKS